MPEGSKKGSGGGVKTRLPPALKQVTPPEAKRVGTPEEVARDESYWAKVRECFTPEPGHIWLNCFSFNPAPLSVHDAFIRYEQSVNAWPQARRSTIFPPTKREALRARLARLINASPEEIALSRNTTEALATVIFGLPLSRGDEVVITTEDYGTFVDAWAQRVRRDGVVLRQIAIPVPPRNVHEIIEPFRQAITPRTKAVMFCHISDLTGLIFPVRELADLAHAAGAQVIVDGALSFGCVPVEIKALDCDYYATSLHKGIFAPTGTGFLYVRRPLIRELWPLLGAPESQDDDIRKFEQWGTAPVAPYRAINEALDFHQRIGTEYLAARYHYLKRSWADRLAELDRVRFLTPLDRAYSCGIAKIHLEGTDPIRLRQHLYEVKRISTWPCPLPEFEGLWVSPYPFTTRHEVEQFADAIQELHDHPDPSLYKVKTSAGS